jgi:hypothetical protein
VSLIDGWIDQKYGSVPAWLKVNLQRLPASSDGDLKSGAVQAAP